MSINSTSSTNSSTINFSTQMQQQVTEKLKTFDSTSSIWTKYQQLDTNNNGSLSDENLSIDNLYSLGQDFGIVPDGKFDETEQKTAGNCYLLSDLKSMSTTEWGSEAINNAVDKNHAGTTEDPYVVKIINANGETEEFTVTTDDINSNKGYYSESGIDTNILEAGIHKYYTSIGKTYDSGIGAGKYSVAYMLTGNAGQGITTADIAEENKDYYTKLTSENLNNVMNNYADNQGNYAMTCRFKKSSFFESVFSNKKNTTVENHAYAIVGVTKNSDGNIESVQYTNPWDSKEVLSMSYEKFCKKVTEVDWHNQ